MPTMDSSSSKPSYLGKRTPHFISEDDRDASSHLASSETAHDERIDILSDKGQQHISSENCTSLLKKKVFLSHSSDQGRFVEQLDEDLRKEGYLPFFHKDPASLPKGEKFPERILQFARECDVAVVVLSEKYLLSKWPMLELETFVDAQKWNNKKILPLFYELGVSALRDKNMLTKMLHAWDVFAKEDARIDATKWHDAIRTLLSTNGEVFHNDSDEDNIEVQEIAYRKRIVESIYDLCPPDVEFDLTNREGYERLCKLVADELDKKLEEGKSAILGLYGMGGLGKTTLCKALCNSFRQRFYGRICYLDLGSKDLLAIKKEALRRLTDLRSRKIVDQLREVQVDDRLRNLLPQQDVFVAIDNPPHAVDSIKWSLLADILKFLSKGSMSIVTSRSSDTLRRVYSLETSNIKQIPSLTEAEAVNVFARVALPTRPVLSLTPDEFEIVQTCVNLCVLKQHSFYTAYHPMALEALGYFLQVVHNRDPLEWARLQAIPEKLADDNLTKIYEIIGRLYYTLYDADRLLFMDVAVFAPREKLLDLDIFLKWLAEVHDTSETNIKQRLRAFAALSLLELEEVLVVMHDFYVDFAHHELRMGSSRIQERCVFKEGGDSLPLALQGTPSGTHWERLVRLRLQVLPHGSGYVEDASFHCLSPHNPYTSLFYRFSEKKLGEWANVVVLHLEFGGQDIDLMPLRCLRSLHLEADRNLRTFTCSKPLEQLRFVRFQCLYGNVKKVPSFTSSLLQELDLHVDMVSLLRPVTLPPASTALTVLRLWKWYSDRQHHELDFEPFPNLIEIVIESEVSFRGHCKLYILGLAALTKLKKLELRGLPIVGPLLGLEKLTNLESLVLRSFWSEMITSLPEMDCFPNLHRLDVSETDIEELKGVEKLLKLKELYCRGCVHLRTLPDLSALPELFLVIVINCPLLENVLVPDNCGYMAPSLDVRNLATSATPMGYNTEGLWNLLPWAAIRQHMANTVASNDPSLAERDVENVQNRVEQELEMIRNIIRQCYDHASNSVEDPHILARFAANEMRIERDRAQHAWDNLGISGMFMRICERGRDSLKFFFTCRVLLIACTSVVSFLVLLIRFVRSR